MVLFNRNCDDEYLSEQTRLLFLKRAVMDRLASIELNEHETFRVVLFCVV